MAIDDELACLLLCRDIAGRWGQIVAAFGPPAAPGPRRLADQVQTIQRLLSGQARQTGAAAEIDAFLAPIARRILERAGHEGDDS